MVTVDVFEVVFLTWTASITDNFMQEWTLFTKSYNTKREEANEQSPYAVVIVKRTAGCTENPGSWP